jgi:hypothetical protein
MRHEFAAIPAAPAPLVLIETSERVAARHAASV